jgi:hypothetical protein
MALMGRLSEEVCLCKIFLKTRREFLLLEHYLHAYISLVLGHYERSVQLESC